MGSFSWLFADTNNTKNLRANRRGYVACPDGTFICEPCYETYGIFDGKDVYDLVVDWNRKFIAENPDHLLPHVHCWTKDGALVRTTYRLKDFPWYPIVAGASSLSISVISTITAVPKRQKISFQPRKDCSWCKGGYRPHRLK